MSYQSVMNFVEMHLRVAQALGLFGQHQKEVVISMPRGVAAKVGDTNVSDNGYHYTRTETGWRLTHHLIAEEHLGRPIGRDETVRFKDGNRENLSPDNIVVTTRKASIRGRIAAIEAKIMELQNEKANLEARLNRLGSNHSNSN